MKAPRHPPSRLRALVCSAGFSLVEVTVAIGIFAFVVVAVVGLFPAAMKMRSESALETRAAMIAQELFAAVRQAPDFPFVFGVRAGPGFAGPHNNYLEPWSSPRGEDISQPGQPVIVGYPANTSVPYAVWTPARSGYTGPPMNVWSNSGSGGSLPQWALGNEIYFLAKLSATKLNDHLYRVDVQVRAPAGSPLTNSSVVSFSTLQYKP